MVEYQKLVDDMFVATKGYIERCFESVRTRFSELETKIAAIPAGPKGDQGEPGAAGKDGVDGKSVELAEVVDFIAPRVDVSIEQAIRSIPLPVNGKDGAPGDVGPQGPQGESIVGPQGERGADGMNGKDGAAGDPGPQGPQGISVTGPQGERGADGINGKDGAAGRDGVGAAGPQGEKGDPGPTGAPGEKGIDGRDGRDGLKGDAGRDALQIDVLDSIDSGRSYPRGTFARHFGGTLRAIRNTDAVQVESPEILAKAGWVVVTEGVADIGLELSEDGRTVKFAVMLTSGRCDFRKFEVPSMIYRGLWAAETAFVRGDTVTWDGNLWHCERATQTEPGIDRAGDWRLAAKKGRDGRDGRRIDPAPVKDPPVRLA